MSEVVRYSEVGMVIGIKYCGGCNPVYDRVKRVGKLRETNPEHEYVTPKGDQVCDYWVVVCGCSRRCAEMKSLKARYKVAVVWDEESFRQLEQELSKSNGENPSLSQEKRVLYLHETAAAKRTITKEDIDMFARLTQDESRLHQDTQVALKTGFDRPLAHGMFIDSLVSALMGTRIPGSGTVYMEHNTRFIRPVFCGDTVEITVRFVSFEEQEDCYIGLFFSTCKNQHGERVLTVRSRQMMKKTLFAVAGERE
jgi:acyl dehydratase